MKNLAMAIVIRDEKVLVQKRFRRQKGMVYEFPGGAVDASESGETAAIRELWEETGLTTTETVAVHQDKNEFGGDIFYVVLKTPSGQKPKEIDPVRQQSFYWFDVNEIPQSDMFPSDIKFISTHLGKYI